MHLAVILKETLYDVVFLFMKFICYNVDLGQNSFQVSEFQGDVSISLLYLSENWTQWGSRGRSEIWDMLKKDSLKQQLETGSESGDKMEKGYRDILEGHVKMGLRCLLLVQLDANEHFCCKRWSRRTWGKLKRNDFYKTSY